MTGVTELHDLIKNLTPAQHSSLILHKLMFLEGVCATNQKALALLLNSLREVNPDDSENQERIEQLLHNSMSEFSDFQQDLISFVNQLKKTS